MISEINTDYFNNSSNWLIVLWKRTVFSVRYELQHTVYCIVFIHSKFQTTLLTNACAKSECRMNETVSNICTTVRPCLSSGLKRCLSQLPVTFEYSYVLLSAEPPVPAHVTCSIHRGMASCDVTRARRHSCSRRSFPK